MPDFTHLLKVPAGKAVSPPALHPGNYPGVISGGPEYREPPPGADYEMVIRFQIKLTGWPDDLDDSHRSYINGQGQQVAIDLSKVRLRRDFFYGDRGLVHLDKLIRSCGIEPDGSKTYDEYLPQLIGQHVVVAVGQYMNNRSNEIGNQVNDLVGTAG